LPRIAVFDVAPATLPVLDPLWLGGGGCLSMMCWWGIRGDGDNLRMWETLRTIKLASFQNVISSCQHDRYTQDESCWVWLQVAGVSDHAAICNKSVWWCVCITRDILQCTTAGIAFLLDIHKMLVEGKEVCWCLSQKIPGILHENDANNRVMLYGCHHYAWFINSEEGNFALFKMSKRTNLDINDAACLHIVHNL
jgi:hypothetical protein